MKLTRLRPILRTGQLHETVRFYTTVLGFTCAELNDDWGWAALFRDEIEIMLALPNAHTPFNGPQFTGSLYITTDDVDGLWASLPDTVTVCYMPETYEWGMREFAIYDNNGYLLQFGQEV